MQLEQPSSSSTQHTNLFNSRKIRVAWQQTTRIILSFLKLIFRQYILEEKYFPKFYKNFLSMSTAGSRSSKKTCICTDSDSTAGSTLSATCTCPTDDHDIVIHQENCLLFKNETFTYTEVRILLLFYLFNITLSTLRTLNLSDL